MCIFYEVDTNRLVGKSKRETDNIKVKRFSGRRERWTHSLAGFYFGETVYAPKRPTKQPTNLRKS